MAMAGRSKLPVEPVPLVKAVGDRRLLGGTPLFPGQLEILEHVEWCNRVVVCAGRRSGKSRLASILLVWQALLRPDLRRYVLPDERIYCVAVAANAKQAKVVLDSAKRLVHGSPLLEPLIERETDEEIHFTNGSTVAAFVCSSRTTRGYPIAALVLDEFAFFQTTDEGPQAAASVYRAMTPSLLQFGDDRRLLICSSPNGENTFKQHFDAMRALEGEDEHAAVGAFQLATWEVRPDIPQSVFDEERAALGEELFSAEYGGEFLAGGGALLAEADIRGCVADGGDLGPREVEGAVCGLDVGWRRDRSAAVILGRDHKDPERLRVAAVRTWAPAEDKALGVERHAEMVLGEVAQLANVYGATVFADTYESATTRARLEAHGVNVELTSTGAGTKGMMYRELASRVRLGQIEYPDHPLLIPELRRLRVSYRGVSPSVENPRVGDSHGDVAAALAMAVFHVAAETGGWPASGSYTPPPRGTVAGDVAAERGELFDAGGEDDGGVFGGYYDSPIDNW